MTNELEYEEKTPREEKLLAECFALIKQGTVGRAAAVAKYRMATGCTRQDAMRALKLID